MKLFQIAALAVACLVAAFAADSAGQAPPPAPKDGLVWSTQPNGQSYPVAVRIQPGTPYFIRAQGQIDT